MEEIRNDTERQNIIYCRKFLRRLHCRELEVRKEYQIEIPNRLAALQILKDSEDINRTWENIKGGIKILLKESLDLCERKQQKPWFDEECQRPLDQRKLAKISEKERGNIGQLILMKWKQTVRTGISEVCILASMTLRSVSSLEPISKG